MVLEGLSFYAWLMMDTGPLARTFVETFGEEVKGIPQKMVSSKMLRQYIKIDTVEKERVFREAFLDYFKQKIEGDR